MALHTVNAIVLRRYPFRETSVLVTCLTDTAGKVKGIIKGLRAPRTRYRSPMEPLTLNRIVYYDTRSSSLHLISQCELLDQFGTLHQDLDVMFLAAFCAELADTVVELEEPQPQLFHFLKDTLGRLGGATTPATREAVRLHYVLRLLRLSGFRPQLDECSACGTRPAPDTGAHWSSSQGGLLCRSCLYHDPSAPAIGPQLLESLKLCSDADEPRPFESAYAPVIGKFLDEFLRWRLPRPLRTARKHSIHAKA
jgi:DNA repair protein RecO (recombination protein O)